MHTPLLRVVAIGAMGAVVAASAFVVACAPRGSIAGGAVVAGIEQHGKLSADRMVRIALAARGAVATVSATTKWRIDEQGGRQLLVRGVGREQWHIEQRQGLLRIAGTGDDATPWRAGPFVLTPIANDGMVQYEGRRYRGELIISATDSGLLVVNRLPVEEYLRGVVPIELGTRLETDRSALEAQAIAARSYAYIRVPSEENVSQAVSWHMLATVVNQVYAGADVEHPVVNAAIDATAGLVLRYGGLLVDAPYSSSCGGRSAVPHDNWRGAREEPYLQPVDDINPATGAAFCDIAPRNHWTAELDESQLSEAVRRALVAAGARTPSPSAVREVRIDDRTPSGRVGTLVLRTDRGDVTVRANDLRAVFRDARGAILPSTYFSIDRESRLRGHLTGVALRGAGNGHGVGMCQWGAIGRSRAGQDARTILRHYYPGTVVGYAD